MSGKERTYRRAFLRFSATAVRKGYPHPGCPVDSLRIPHPGCFGTRGCKLLKTKDRSYGIRKKRLQEIDRSRVRVGAAGGAREISSR